MGVRRENDRMDVAGGDFTRYIPEGEDAEYMPLSEAVAYSGLSKGRFYAHAGGHHVHSYKSWHKRGAFYKRAEVVAIFDGRTRWSRQRK